MANFRLARPARSVPFQLPQCFSAPPPPPLPSFLVLNPLVPVDVGAPTPPLGWIEQAEWALVECASRTAHACGDRGQEMLDGLDLYARLVRPGCVTSSLHIRASGGAVRAIRAELAAMFPDYDEETGFIGWRSTTIDDAELCAQGIVLTADENHFVVILMCRIEPHYLYYYVVYDAVARSLSMVPCPATCKVKPLTVRHGADGGYRLVLISDKMVPPSPSGGDYPTFRDVLYVWAPSAATSKTAACDDDEDYPWRVQGWRVPPLVERPDMPRAMFVFQDKAFFSELSECLLCCDLPTTATDRDGVSAVDLDFIPLPGPPRWDVNRRGDQGTVDEKRTMRCVQGSIMFVGIDSSAAGAGRPGDGDTTVSLWTLDLPSKNWRLERLFRARELWKLAGFKRAGLPNTAPKCPVLMPDGTLCLLLPRLRTRLQDPIGDHICNLDVQNMRLRWSASLDNCSDEAPIILPWNFFTAVVPPTTTMVRRGIFM